MYGNRQDRKARTVSSRRDFFRTGALIATAAAAVNSTGTRTAHAAKSGGEVLYESELVPENPSFRLALVTDHHYWPNHAKNWSGKLFRETDRRMRDLVERLNAEAPDISIHAGDVIDAGNSFYVPPDEYIAQLDFAKEFIDSLEHRAIPLIGNHEVPDNLYESEDELAEWKKRFGGRGGNGNINGSGGLHGFVDRNGWRMIWLNSMIPNPGEVHGPGSLYGIDDAQMTWLPKVLGEAAAKDMHVLLFAHMNPKNFINGDKLMRIAAKPGCVKAMIVGHAHANYVDEYSGIPVYVRAANVLSPLAYSMIYPYPDGRVVIVQKSQHFPYLDFVSTEMIDKVPQAGESERYVTVGGSSEIGLDGITVLDKYARARVADGHIRFEAKKGKGIALFDIADLDNVRLSFSATKDGAARMGVVACANSDASERVEGVLTEVRGADGNMYIASCRGENRRVLDRSWFNIIDGVAYHFVLEVKNGRVTMKNTRMPELTVELPGGSSGRLGFFVERGAMYITDLKLEVV